MKSTTTRKNIPVSNLKPSPENGSIYNQRGPDHPDQRGLIESIRKSGVLSPLQVSRDWFIISGHSRLAAAQHVGLTTVPVEILPIRRSDHSSDEWVKILREHNHGRTKTIDEMTREALVDVSDDMVLRAAMESRKMQKDGTAAAVQLSVSRKTRAKISSIKQPMAKAIVKVLEELGPDLPVSVRSVHYQLLRNPPRRNSRRPRSIYTNDTQSYKDLCGLLARMRLAEIVPWSSIRDELRPVREWKSWQTAADFVREKSKSLYDGFARNLQQSQRVYFAVVVEKDTVRGFLEDTAYHFRIPLVVSRGQSSVDMRNELAQLFRRSGKDSLHLFIAGDCDADGDAIVDATCRSLRDEFKIANLTADRFAIDHAQADQLSLPRSLEAKSSSKNYSKFLKRHGRTDCYELEAVSPAQLREWLDSAIRSRIDMQAFNHEVDQQQQELRFILAKKRSVLDVMSQNADMSDSLGDDE